MSIGAFGEKVFDVSENRIYTFDDFGRSESLNVEMQETEGGKPATYIKGIGEMNISFSILLLFRWVNVDYEVEWWFDKLRKKEPEYLTVGNKAYSTNKFLLTDVDEVKGETIFAQNGKRIRTKLNLTFKEYTKSGYKKTK